MSVTPLAKYNEKRDFEKTPEPAGKAAKRGKQLSYVIQKHWASHLHYDFRLELDGVLLSWAVPKGPSLDPKVKRMAIHVEDHPVSYGSFEGRIPEKQYGAGTVIVWDRGTWDPVGDPRDAMTQGKLVFALHGEKLTGLWELVRIAKPGERQEPWILFKKRDDWARPTDEFDVVTALPDSVIEKPLGLAEQRERRAHAEPVQSAKATRKASSTMPEGAVKASLPATLAPQLAALTKTPPTGDAWSVEAKFDGYRIVARIEKGKVRLITRNGNDWTDKLGSLAKSVESLDVREGWLDGEIVVAKASGGQDFNALQNAIDHARSDDIVYFLFDAPYLNGYDLRAVPLSARRAELKAILDAKPNERVRFSDDFPSSPAEVLEAACAMKLEGVIVKRRDAPYVSARSDTWLKLKCTLRQEFVIGGYTDRSNSTTEIGNLFLGVYEAGKLRYAGAMGTGWNLSTARELKQRLKKLEIVKSPFEIGSTKQNRWSKRIPGTEHWVKPVLVAEASFAEWTPEGHLRHASFQGLRTDKPAKSIVREQAADLPADAEKPLTMTKPSVKAAALKKSPGKKASATAAGGKAIVSGVQVSSPERVIDASTGETKLDLVRYYDSVADLILPHLAGRPVSLVRGPSGVDGELFFQKHMEAKIAGVTVLDAALWPEHAALIEIHTKEALLSATQFNTIEFHTWNAKVKAIDRPDRMIFDLDPGAGTSWAHVREGAMLTHAMLDELGLVTFLKTSGGKGLHLVVPLTPRADWDTVKGFSQAIVQHLATTIPDRFVAKSGGANRVGKIFVDYLRNGHGATTAVAFSARSRPGLGVSMPVAWDDLASLKSGAQWTVATARDYLSFRKADPWAGYASTRQTLTAAMKRLGYAGPK
ncbi:MAG: DNA ligase D [Burkholderiaceae bacterium]